MTKKHCPHANADLSHEIAIVWDEPIEKLQYVREVIQHHAGTRQRPVPWNGSGRRVGYAILDKKATGHLRGYWARRVFFLNEGDRDTDPDGCYKTGAPCEAVDPATVAPGKPGELTERAWGGPLDKKEAR